MQSRVVAWLLVLAVGCHHAKGPTLTGAALYAQVLALHADKHAPVVGTSGAPLEVRTDQFLVTAEQVFTVWQVVENCKGGDPTADVDCTLALLMDKKFRLRDTAPNPKAPDADGADLSPKTKAILVLTGLGAAMTYGAFKCDVFDGCKTLLGIGAGLDGLVLLVLLVGGRD